MVAEVQDYVPGYHLRGRPGNLDIITAAAARVGDIMIAHRFGVASTWKTSAELGDLGDPGAAHGGEHTAYEQKAGV
jgi:hypothetical protein